MTRAPCWSWNSRWPPAFPTAISPPSCTSSRAGRHERPAATGPPPLRRGEPRRHPAQRPGGARRAGQPRPAGPRRRAGRRTPDRGAAGRRARLAPDPHGRAVRAGAGRDGRDRRPAADHGFPLHHPDQPGEPGQWRRARRARGARLPGPGAGHRGDPHSRLLDRRAGSAPLAAGADAAGAGPRGRGGGDGGEPAGVRRQRPDRGGQPRRRLPGCGRAGGAGPGDARGADRRPRPGTGLRLPPRPRPVRAPGRGRLAAVAGGGGGARRAAGAAACRPAARTRRCW